MSYMGTKTIGGGQGMPFVDARQGQRDINQRKEMQRQKQEKASALADDQKRLEMLAQGLGAGKEVKAMSRGELKGFIESTLAKATEDKAAADRELAERKQRSDMLRIGQAQEQLNLQRTANEQRRNEFTYRKEQDAKDPLGDILRSGPEKPNFPKPAPASGIGKLLAGAGLSKTQSQRDAWSAWENHPDTQRRQALETQLGPLGTTLGRQGMLRTPQDVATLQGEESRFNPDPKAVEVTDSKGKVIAYRIQVSKNNFQLMPVSDLKPIKPQAAVDLVNEMEKAKAAGDTERLLLLVRDQFKESTIPNQSGKWPPYLLAMLEESNKIRKTKYGLPAIPIQ